MGILALSEEYDTLRNLVMDHMKWDIKKADQWMALKNPLLGGISPLWMIVRGRGHKVKSFILAAIDENKPMEGQTKDDTTE